MNPFECGPSLRFPSRWDVALRVGGVAPGVAIRRDGSMATIRLFYAQRRSDGRAYWVVVDVDADKVWLLDPEQQHEVIMLIQAVFNGSPEVGGSLDVEVLNEFEL